MKKKSQLLCNIAYTIDYRGENDDELTLCFRGITYDVADRVFRWLGGGGNTFSKYEIVREHDSIRRNGFGFWRIAVKIRGFNAQFCGLDDFCLLVEARIKAEQPCNITRMTMQKFLNV